MRYAKPGMHKSFLLNCKKQTQIYDTWYLPKHYRRR